MRTIYKLLFLFLVLVNSNILFAQTNHAPVVTNVDFTIRPDGSKIVDITYDVFDADSDTLKVTIEASSDGGATWGLSCANISGAIGKDITSGAGKTIVWNTGVEHPNFYSPTVQIRITANDLYFGTCGDQLIYAGKSYNTVQIGSQCWLKENLDVGVYAASTSTGSSHSDVSNNGLIEKYCYNNDTANCTSYGGLYDWNEAMAYSTTPGTKGICPTGWHIPTKAEFETLIAAVGNDGNALKAVGQGTRSGVGTNTSGFSALSAGYRGNTGYFYNLGANTTFWSSTEYIAATAYSLYLWYDDSNIYVDGTNKGSGFSVRCLED